MLSRVFSLFQLYIFVSFCTQHSSFTGIAFAFLTKSRMCFCMYARVLSRLLFNGSVCAWFTCALCPCVCFPMSLSCILCSYNCMALFLSIHSSVWYSSFFGHRLCFLISYSSPCVHVPCKNVPCTFLCHVSVTVCVSPCTVADFKSLSMHTFMSLFTRIFAIIVQTQLRLPQFLVIAFALLIKFLKITGFLRGRSHSHNQDYGTLYLNTVSYCTLVFFLWVTLLMYHLGALCFPETIESPVFSATDSPLQICHFCACHQSTWSSRETPNA